jgi:hypothetical protein
MIAFDFRWYVVEDLFPKGTFLHGISAAAWSARVDEFPGKILSLSRSPNVFMGTEEQIKERCSTPPITQDVNQRNRIGHTEINDYDESEGSASRSSRRNRGHVKLEAT